jgi:hypothetical protein
MSDDVKFTDLFKPGEERSDRELIEQRLAVCNLCPAFRKNTKRCSKCGCFMQLKTTLRRAKCPIGKW